MHAYIQADRHPGRQTDNQASRQADSQADGQTARQTDRQRQADRQTARQTDTQPGRQTHRQTVTILLQQGEKGIIGIDKRPRFLTPFRDPQNRGDHLKPQKRPATSNHRSATHWTTREWQLALHLRADPQDARQLLAERLVGQWRLKKRVLCTMPLAS